MKKVVNAKVGQLVRIPTTCFDTRRTGWNGWIFRTGVIEKLYISRSGVKCAAVRYCVRRAGRYQLLPCEETTKNVKLENVFTYNRLALDQASYTEFKALENAGEQICWDEDTAFLLNNGFIK